MGGPAWIDETDHYEADNCGPCEFVIAGVTYYSAENYFQCQKSVGVSETDYENTRLSGTGDDVWYAGSQVKLRPDWELVKVRVMYAGNQAKFTQHPEYAKQLTDSKGPVVFGWEPTFWNVWNAKIITLLREELRPKEARDETVIKQIWSEIIAYEHDQIAQLEKQ
eukprot:TRINITY_DN9538_c0_g1_i1.p1 TRINITY_DN9538_c0_g1~~TRINITY_DN9538_c0_g1_i1.p1  ORF type:complete len:175 (+),score=31.54 TRINITY_DN9538_c0_g1_i1:32-526(+)